MHPTTALIQEIRSSDDRVIYTAARKTEVSELSGLGRAMPFTFAAFMIGALSIIGLPPFGGLWGKWYLVLGALDAGQLMIVAVLMIALLTLLPFVGLAR